MIRPSNLLEWSAESHFIRWSFLSLCVVHSLKRFVGFRLGRKPHKSKSTATVGISIFDDDLNAISHCFTRCRRDHYSLFHRAELLEPFV